MEGSSNEECEISGRRFNSSTERARPLRQPRTPWIDHENRADITVGPIVKN